MGSLGYGLFGCPRSTHQAEDSGRRRFLEYSVTTEILTKNRTPLDHLVSEALHQVREALAVFPDTPILTGDGRRQQALRKLLAQDNLEPAESDKGDSEVVISAGHQPPECSGTPFGRRARIGEDPLAIYPLADWNEQAVDAFLGERNEFCRPRELRKLCVVGDSDTGKSEMIAELVKDDSAVREEHPIPRYLWTDSRLLILRETRGKHASDLAIVAAAWDSDWALLTIDAERGLTDLSRRLLFLLALSGVPHLVVAVTKLREVKNPESRYRGLVGEINHLLASTSQLNLTAVIPADSDLYEWYRGESLKAHLERVVFPTGDRLQSLRLPVQYREGSIASGRITGGILAIGDEIVCLPSGDKAVVRELRCGDRNLERAGAGDSVRIKFDAPTDLQKGNILVSEGNYPVCSSELDATLLWIGEEAPGDHASYRLYHQAHFIDAQVADVKSCLLPESYEWSDRDTLATGKVGHVNLTTASPLFFDSFFKNRQLGRFLLLHPDQLKVVGLGILRGEVRKRHEVTNTPERLASKHVVVDPTEIDHNQRREKYGHRGAVLWFTGLSGSGKSAAAKKTEKALHERGCHTLFLDGDNVRTGFNGDLGFTQEERSESNRRVAELAALVYQQGQIVICSFISGSKEGREFARSLVGRDFYLCYVDCPVEVCRERDPKGLYEKAEAGELLSFTGVSLPYEKPEDAELVLDSTEYDPTTLSNFVIEMLEKDGVI